MKKSILLVTGILGTFSLFSFKNHNENMQELSNMSNYKEITSQNTIEEQQDLEVATAAVGRAAVKVWQKSSREVVYAAVALWPLSAAEDAIVSLNLNQKSIKEVKYNKL
ncbi:MAG: hypothetical protein ACRC8M_13170 [Cetobacterium sp.]|uniref:hypothetical protein n=1 Tax=Cetobacterium sp. TaxID=2071632 RepID=UPI003F375EAE